MTTTTADPADPTQADPSTASAQSAQAAQPNALPQVVGRLAERQDDRIVLRIPETSYRLHLMIAKPLDAQPNARVAGVVHVHARRVDVVPAGGRYVEPVYGRPRRIQGRVIGGDVQRNTLHVHCGLAVVVHLMPAQQAADFKIGQMVSFDVEPGARFEQN